MLRVEDFTIKNLEECVDFINNEIVRVKKIANSSGFTKYSPMGMVIIKYRTELKKLHKEMLEDLNELYSKKEI